MAQETISVTKSSTNQELANKLKQDYGINKNISQSLTQQQKQEILHLVEENDAVLMLVNSFIAKNNELSNNNRNFGRQRERANKNLKIKQEENEELITEVSQLRLQLKELKKLTHDILVSFQYQLTNDMLNRSEIISTVNALLNVFKVKDKTS